MFSHPPLRPWKGLGHLWWAVVKMCWSNISDLSSCLNLYVGWCFHDASSSKSSSSVLIWDFQFYTAYICCWDYTKGLVVASSLALSYQWCIRNAVVLILVITKVQLDLNFLIKPRMQFYFSIFSLAGKAACKYKVKTLSIDVKQSFNYENLNVIWNDPKELSW